jgi:hypothetical protein
MEVYNHQQKIVQFLGNMNGSFGKSMGNATLRVVKQICELELQKH